MAETSKEQTGATGVGGAGSNGSGVGAGGGLPKVYSPSETEGAVGARWDAAKGGQGAFHADPGVVLRGERKPYCILIPPPNVTAALHLGHALNNTLQDVLARAHRMMGYETLWMPGTDHAGIATQTVVDRRLKSEGEPALGDYKKMEAAGEDGRGKFIAQVQAWKDEYERVITDQLKVMGCSCDWARQRFTMDEQCASAVREAFFRLFKDGLIYRGKRLVNWDPVTQTALADDEVEMQEVEGIFAYLRYPLVHGDSTVESPNPVTWSELEARGYPGEMVPEGAGGDDIAFVTVATTRPETYMGDTAVAVNPKDPRAGSLRGMKAELPLVGRIVPIVEDEYVVLPAGLWEDPEEGAKDGKARMATGFLKVTPAHDTNDWEIGLRHEGVISRENSSGKTVVNIMGPDASISDAHGWDDVGDAHVFVGKSREEARELVLKEFKARHVGDSQLSLLERVVEYEHAVGHSYRSHAAIEPYLSDQWYVKVSDDRLRGAAQRALKKEQRTEGSLRLWGEMGSDEPRPSGSGSWKNLFLTFTTYGTWLHGDERGSVDREHNLPGTPLVEPDAGRVSDEERRLKLPSVELDRASREVVARAVQGVCSYRGWTLHACNVRSNHVHVVVTADQSPERVLVDLKSYSTRALKGSTGLDRERLWTRHGSTRYLNDEDSFNHAVHYVLHEQGDDLGGVVGGPLPHGRGSFGDGGVDGGPLPHGRGSFGEGDGDLEFFPARYAKNYETWHDNLRDWCISRQLWWGHRIPVWSVPRGGAFSVDLRKKIEDWEAGGRVCVQQNTPSVGDVVGHAVHDSGASICVRDPEDQEVVQALESEGFAQDPDVLDTWFSSALWPLSTLGWPGGGGGVGGGGAWVKRVGTWKDFIGAEGEESGELIAVLLKLRDRHLQEGGEQVLDYRLYSGVELDRAGVEGAEALVTPDAIQGCEDLVCVVRPMVDGLLAGERREPIGWFLARHGFSVTEPELLEAFNPTSVLCTAREIITLWVSRMVMFNRYFLGENGCAGRVPFRDVYIHAMIQDGDGRKMSKSLGNGVDPRDIIATHGADAMRYTLVKMTTQTQDVRMPVVEDEATGKNTSPKFDEGRNFCNKLWNAAGGFVLRKLGDHVVERGDPVEVGSLSIVDRWMLSRLARATGEIERAIGGYQFAEYATALYDVLWRDFCDWYVEACKATIDTSADQREVLRTSLDVLLRLLHPVAPFVTERIHEELLQVSARGVNGVGLETDALLSLSSWPRFDAGLIDEGSEEAFGRVRELVEGINGVRAKHRVPPRQKVKLHVPDPVMGLCRLVPGVVEQLGGLSTVESGGGADGGVAFRALGEDMWLSELSDALDAVAERERVEGELAKLTKSARALEGRLSNPGYVEKAPAKLVDETRAQLEGVKGEIAALREKLEGLS